MYKENYFLTSSIIKLVFITPGNYSHWFGYYNYSPLDLDNNRMLAHRVNFDGRNITDKDVAEIGWFDLKDGSWNLISETRAFNWQQGSMLQWLGTDFKKIIFNDVVNNKYVSRIINLETKKNDIIPHAIYGITPDGKFSISLNFERCYYTRAYNYAPIINEKWNKRIPNMDGIVKVDLNTGKVSTIINLKQFLNSRNLKDDGKTMHWFEHIMLNPSGTRFAFYHRYGSKESFSTNIYTSDMNGNNICKHPSFDDEKLAHFGWLDDRRYVVTVYSHTKFMQAWGKSSEKKKGIPIYINFYRKLIKPYLSSKIVKLATNNDQFYVLTKDKCEVLKKMNPNLLTKDGHPSFTKNGRFMLTDTYANDDGYRLLLLFDIYKTKLITVGKFYSPFNNCAWRADLHPRFSPNENYIIIDSAHNSYHQMMVFEIDWTKING